MQTEPVHHKNRHVAEKVEGMMGMIMIGLVVVLAVALVWMIVATGDVEPTWMR